MLQDEYARAIIALQEEGKNDAEIASGIARVLRARGHERLIPRIARSLQAYELRKSKKDARVLRVSKIEDTTIFAKEIADALSALKEDGRAYETVVDDRIVGGFVLASGTTMVDASYRTALVSLYRTITADR
jgi:F0F1-type ATP synthase delta subunit